ncbi:MAG TPA: type II secretion system protein GspM, partial [Thermoleophilaceae bacterium]|nr:type II secretion system protein GspM [Thermoleophilaceae bacterium]
MTISDRDKKILTFLVPLLLIAGYWFLVLSPKREEVTTAETALTEQQDRLAAARSAANAAENAERGFETSYATVVRLGKAIPSTVDMPSLLVQLEAAAEGTGIRFNSISAGERTALTTAAPAESGDAEAPASDAGGAPAQTAPGAAVESANNAEQTSDARNGAAEQSGVDTTTSTSARDGGLPVGGGAAGGTGQPAAA